MDLTRIEHIRVGDSVYCFHFLGELDRGLAGVCYMDRKCILISTNQSIDEILASIFHELLHSIERESKIKLGHKIINKMEYPLAQIFIQLMRLYSAEEKKKKKS